MTPQLRVGQVGATIRVVITDGGLAIDLSTATVKILKLSSPYGPVVEKAATFTTNGTDGSLEYVLAVDDLNEAGPWRCQPYVELGTEKFHGSPFGFQVGENLS